MPPEDEKQLTDQEHQMMLTLFGSYLKTYIKESASLKSIVMRRMNRYEYNNAVRDLLQLKGDVYPLPEKVIEVAHILILHQENFQIQFDYPIERWGKSN